jgi:predicted RNA binding protein YcfA (HicA-like mRNA interferase family)
MTQADKKLEKMRNNSKDWQIADLEVIASRFGITVRQGKGSHMSFSHKKCVEILTIPAHRPVKPIYVKKFLSLIDVLIEEET